MSKNCPDDKVLNPATGRCVSKDGAIGKKLLKASVSTPAPKKNKGCPDDKVLNPDTGRCVSKDGAIGKKLLKALVSRPVSRPAPTPAPAPAPVDIITNNTDDNVCNDVITIPQHQNTCWFTALLMSLLYSQYSRELLLKKPFNTDTNVRKVLNDILINHYIENDNYLSFFKNLNLHDLLKYFISNETIIKNIIKKGFDVAAFIPYFMNVINKSFIMLNKFDNINNEVYGSFINNYHIPRFLTRKEPNINKDIILKELNQSPDYIYLTILPKSYKINDKINDIVNIFNLKNYSNIKYDGINELKEVIEYNGHIYFLDSCILNNFNVNSRIPSHSISGIKCKNKKFVYNGWISSTKDPAMLQRGIQHIPCKLMKFDWDVKKDNNFCINPIKCDLVKSTSKKDLCFSFNKGYRTLIYVKQSSITSATTPKPATPKPATAKPDDDYLSIEEKELLKNLPSYISKTFIYNIDRIVDFMTNDKSYSYTTKINELKNMLNDLNDIQYEVSTDVSTRTDKQREKAQPFLKYNDSRIKKVDTLLKQLIKKNDKIMEQASRKF